MKANGKANGYAQKLRGTKTNRQPKGKRKDKPTGQRKRKPAKPPRLNIVQLSKDTGLSRPTLYKWKAEGCPLEQGAEAILAWRDQNHPEPEKSQHYDRLLLARARKEEARALAEEQDNLRRTGKTMLVETAERYLASLANVVRTRIESWPEKAIEEVPIEQRPAVLESLNNQVYLLLTELSQCQLEA